MPFSELATDSDRLDEADRAIGTCLKVQPTNVYCLYQFMFVRIKQNRFYDVLNTYKALPPSLRNYPWFDEALGIALLADGQVDPAAEAFERLGSHYPRLHGTIHFIVGKEWMVDVWLYEGRINDATRRLEQILEADDDTSARGGYFSYLSHNYALLGNAKQTKKYASESAKALGDPSNLTRAALALASVGDSKGAEALLNVRLKLTRSSLPPAYSHLIRGLLFMASGKRSDGIEEIRMAHDLSPRDEETAYWLGMGYLRSKDFRSAVEAFRLVRNMKGSALVDDEPLLPPLATYRLAQCYERMGDSAAAKPYRDEVAQLWAHADEDLERSLAAN